MRFWLRLLDRLTGGLDRDLERELRTHLDLETEERQEAGLPVEEARYAAQRAFGNTLLVKEDTRAMWGWTWVEHLGQDLRYAVRTMRKTPSFTVVAVMTLALGIGANTAVFTFVNVALLKPLPYPNADRIVALLQRPLHGRSTSPVAPRSFVPWHERARSFEALAMAQSIPVNTMGLDGAEQVSGLWTTPELFKVFGIGPSLGRTFNDGEGLNRLGVRGEAAAEVSVVVLSHGYWQRQFGADPHVIGKVIPIGRGSAVIVGVMPASFRVGTLNVDLYLPIYLDRNNPNAIGSRGFQCYGLLRLGVTLAAAQAEMSVLADQIGRQEPGEKDWGVVVLSFRDYLVRDNRVALLTLLGVVGFVLLIACANLAGLVLTRGIGRRSELALRASLGATRSRLVQQLVIESLALSVTGGGLGLLLGSWASRTLVFLTQDAVEFGQMADVRMDAGIFAFAMMLSVLTAIVFGLPSAWQVSRFDLQTTLREQGRGAGESLGQQRFRAALVVAEVALALVLLVGAGLLLRSLSHLLTVKLGFQPEQVLTMRMIVTGDPGRRSSLIERVLDRIELLRDVRAVGTIQFLPLGGWTNNGPFHFLGRPLPADPKSMESDVSTVSRGYFAAMGIPVLRGRVFGRQDRIDSPRVALVNQAFVSKYSPNEDPIGLRIFGDWANPKPTEIVGVVGDIRHNGLTAEPRPTVFLAQVQVPGYITHLVVRTAAEPHAMSSAIRREIQQVDPSQAVTAIQMMEKYVSASLARPRLYTVLLGTFAWLALLLASVGVYGLLAYEVSRRTHEIGIRMALGAQQRDVLTAMLNRGTQLVLLGTVLGGACAFALSRLVDNLLYGVKPTDLLTYAGAAVLLVAVAVVATYLPARRASRVDPMVAVRHE